MRIKTYLSQKIRISGDIDKINSVLKSKFLEVNNKPIGVGQIVTSIVQIVENNFKFDNYVNTQKNITIYPILLVNDRIFEILGVNYRSNQWHLEPVKEKLGDKYNANFIKPLTDIDTLIFWTPHLIKKDVNLKDIIDDHLRKMTTQKKVDHPDMRKRKLIASKNLTNQIAPISSRKINYKFPTKLIIEKFLDVITE